MSERKLRHHVGGKKQVDVTWEGEGRRNNLQIWWGKRGMLLLLQEQTCLAFFSLSVAVSENVVGPASAKTLKAHWHQQNVYAFLVFSLKGALCTQFLKASECLRRLW